LLQRLVLYISQSDTVIEAAGDGVSVFDYAHVFAGEGAFTEENVVEPGIEVGHLALFCDAGEKGTVHVDFRFSVVLQPQIINFIPNLLELLRRGSPGEGMKP
jgi:hypothetical protein